jgi:hypothetical protein
MCDVKVHRKFANKRDAKEMTSFIDFLTTMEPRLITLVLFPNKNSSLWTFSKKRKASNRFKRISGSQKVPQNFKTLNMGF